jgi:hypothetical protein
MHKSISTSYNCCGKILVKKNYPFIKPLPVCGKTCF